MANYEALLNIVTNYKNSDVVEESVRGKIGSKVRELKDRLSIEKDWIPTTKATKTYEEKDLDEDKFHEISKALHDMRASSTFTEYKIYYNKLCKLTGIPKNDVVIVQYKLNKDKEHNSVEILYGVAPKKITIPNGSILYHTSTNDSIKSLNPQFKGKSAKSYMYSDQRVYFTLRKEMPKFAADIKQNEKTTTYVCTENIKTAYLDPLVPTYTMGAVYVVTSSPIKVEKIQDILKKSDDLVQEYVDYDLGPEFDNLEDFMEYYGLKFVEDDEVYQEGIKEKIGEITRSISGTKFLKDTWKKASENLKDEISEKDISNKDKKEIRSNYDIAKNSNNYTIYKKAFNWICKFFGIGKNSIIKKITVDGDKAICDYTEAEPRKITIPNETMLLHVSPKKGIKELIPSFKGKREGSKLYPTKRVYFTLSKDYRGEDVPESDLSRYTPKENIRTAFIDPTCKSFNAGSIYVDTSLPIPVEEIKSTTTTESALKESFINNELSLDEFTLLSDSIK